MAVAPISSTDLQKFAILLDVDGTLLDIAPTPDGVQVSGSLRDTLIGLWRRAGGALALVSGRPLADLDRIFAPARLPAIGGHGAEIRPAIDRAPLQRPTVSLDDRLRRRLTQLAGGGVLVEDKGYSLALHYRNVPEREGDLRETVAAICAEMAPATIEILPGKAVIEVKSARFNKGSGVRELMAHPPFAGRRPLFIGDDVTDEAVFAVLPEFEGIGISVGRYFPGVSGMFDGPREVRQWLERILQGREAATT
jgi:trehalose 6-phosphate phosphatase